MIFLIGKGLLGSAIDKHFSKKNSCLKHEYLNRQWIDLECSLEILKDNLERKKRAVRVRGMHPSERYYLINAAGYTNVDGAENDGWDEAFKLNAAGPYKLAQACRALDIVLIHISSDFVFDGRKKIPYDEYDKRRPINRYGETKHVGEKMIEGSGCEYMIVRTSHIYNEEQGIVPDLIKLVQSEKRVKGVEDRLIAPTLTYSVAHQLEIMIWHDLRGIFHATNQGGVKPIDLLQHIAAKLGKEVDIDKTSAFSFFNGRAQRPAMCILNSLNLGALGLDVMSSWEEPVDNVIKKYLPKNS